MISNSANVSRKDPVPPSPALNSSKDGPKTEARNAAPEAKEGPAVSASAPDWNYESRTSLSYSRTEDLYLKYTSRDGDVLEMSSHKSETADYRELLSISAGAKALAADDAKKKAGGKDAAGNTEETDPKAKQLAELREWARQVEKEVRQQQLKILEQILKQSGKHVEAGEGRFLMVMPDGGPDASGPAAKTEAAPVPEYWNAENTSDRIVHFATQMAEISGLDPKEFAESIRKAIGDGFDQAHEATGDLTGPAAKLNQDTRDLVFTKLSKWLEEREPKMDNQGPTKQAI
ncbi:MAG: hypothetical protein JWP91_277 [Fibrobacteres bacterium]|nr:hypothetical protein [Fibrobacterota bacterium]